MYCLFIVYSNYFPDLYSPPCLAHTIEICPLDLPLDPKFKQTATFVILITQLIIHSRYIIPFATVSSVSAFDCEFHNYNFVVERY